MKSRLENLAGKTELQKNRLYTVVGGIEGGGGGGESEVPSFFSLTRQAHLLSHPLFNFLSGLHSLMCSPGGMLGVSQEDANTYQRSLPLDGWTAPSSVPKRDRALIPDSWCLHRAISSQGCQHHLRLLVMVVEAPTAVSAPGRMEKLLMARTEQEMTLGR